jgi:alpha-ketoglutarate-dependent taurine dioxygenase
MTLAFSAKLRSTHSTQFMTDSTFPCVIENQVGWSDMTLVLQWLDAEAEELKAQLAKTGALLFRGFPVRNAEDFDAFSAAFGYQDFTYSESLSNAVRVNFTPRVFTANEAPPDVEIFLHHEMAQTPVSPEKLFFCCLSAAETGGATPLCRSDWLYAAFKERHPLWAQQFESLGLKYRIQMPAEEDSSSGQGRSWRSTLSVETTAQAEHRLTELGYSWRWSQDGSLITTTPVLAAVMELPDGSQSFFNQVLAAHLGWKPVGTNQEEPLTFGNDDIIPTGALRALVEIARELTLPLAWKDGDVALVDNHRVMHGREPFGGSRKRQVVVCLARDL